MWDPMTPRTSFQVWAPRAGRVEVEVNAERHAMSPGERGWWRAEVPAGPGAEYAYVLDGGPTLPDPRSPWQSHGVHGRSRCVDHTAFAWTDRHWQAAPLCDGVVYELHVGTFSAAGTFAGAAERLPHLVDLGITHVEIMPVAEFPGARGWGYDGVDLYAPHHAYGTPDDLKRLVDACHAHGLGVILDVVYNHLGPSGNYLDRFGPYFTHRYATPWGVAVNLDDAGSDEVRRFFTDDAKMWLRDYHFDGLRLDAVHAIFDSSAKHFLEELAEEVAGLERELGRRFTLIAESDLNDPRLLRAPEHGGFGLHAQWNEDFHHALHALLTGERHGYFADFGSLADLARALRHAFVLDGCYSRFRDRRHGRAPAGLTGDRFVGFLQNHDQIGNRARGDRTSHLLAPARLELAAALVLTAPFVPMLFQGEEWGASTPFQYFTDHAEPELAQAVREGRRRELASFGWDPHDVPDPQAEETFARCKLDWSEPERAPHAALLDWHRRLIALRRREPDLRDGRLERVEVDFDEAARWLVLRRGSLAVACNLSAHPQPVPIRAAAPVPLLWPDERPELVAGGVRLQADGVAVCRVA